MARHKIKNPTYVRVATFSLDEVIPFIFTRDVRRRLREAGHSYRSKEWKEAGRKTFTIPLGSGFLKLAVSMGSHRYQLFAEKGTNCVCCGLKGRYFALERGWNDNPMKYHLNLYGLNEHGHEVMITKDHIVPKSGGGANKLTNYQPLCFKCNQKKGNKLEYDKISAGHY